MNTFQYYFIQEGCMVPLETAKLFREQFSSKDIEEKEGDLISKFTGVIISPTAILISFPKHYFEEKELLYFQKDISKAMPHIQIIFAILTKINYQKFSNQWGINSITNSNYPFHSFNEIMKYYKQYGLYKQDEYKTIKGYSGKINWKTTIKKSTPIYSNNSMIYMPFYINKKSHKHVFISECMAYSLNTTIEKFRLFIKEHPIPYDTNSLNINFRDAIVEKLQELKFKIFKDQEKDLLNNLILFFENFNQGTQHIEIKTHNFNLLWEDMMEVYLNDKFLGIDEEGFIIINSASNITSPGFKKKILYPDLRAQIDKFTYRLEPDHYLLENNNLYLFDSKYYTEVNGLNYKQISYYFLLKHHHLQTFNKDKSKVYNILLLPTSKKMNDPTNKKVHFILNPDYNRSEENFKILEQYFNVQDVIKNYIT